MGTFYTFTTALIRDEQTAIKTNEAMKAYKKLDNSFSFKKIVYPNVCYFVGCFKNYGGGPYQELIHMKLSDMDLVWVSDEGDYGEWMRS
jgi:hypothetical protein